MSRRGWLISVVATLVLAVGAAWWWSRQGGAEGVAYRTARLERGTLQATVSASGTVTPVRQVQVSSQVSGQIRDVHVDFNSEVKQGQLIAQLDPESFEYRLRQASADVEASRASVLTAQAQVQSALAQLARADVELQEARRDLERKEGLVAQNFISPAEADTARAKVATLQAARNAADAQVQVARAQARNTEALVRQREAQLAQARVDLERTQIRSPVDGIVIKRSVEVGQTVAASLQAPELFVIARNLSDMQVEAAIDEADIARVRPAQTVGFTIDAFPGRSFDGIVRQVRKAATSAQNVVTYTVVVGFANPGSTLLPGMTANVRIVTDVREQVLKVPNAALRVRIPGIEPDAAPSARVARGAAPAAMLGDAQAQPRGDPAAAALPSGEDGAAAGGGPLAEFRRRLLAELELSPAQQQSVDAIFAAQRPRFAELRSLPDEERGRARERMLADVRAQIGEQLTPAQHERYRLLVAEAAGRQTTRGRLYLLADDGRPRALNVRLGITDGAWTELVVSPGSPDAAVLKEGATVITGVTGSPTPRGHAPAGPRLMF